MGSYEEAELLYRHALEGCEKVLGLEHPQTQGILQNFGNMLHKKGDFYGCILLYRSALKGCERRRNFYSVKVAISFGGGLWGSC
jgi:hypothetical protein